MGSIKNGRAHLVSLIPQSSKLIVQFLSNHFSLNLILQWISCWRVFEFQKVLCWSDASIGTWWCFPQWYVTLVSLFFRGELYHSWIGLWQFLVTYMYTYVDVGNYCILFRFAKVESEVAKESCWAQWTHNSLLHSATDGDLTIKVEYKPDSISSESGRAVDSDCSKCVLGIAALITALMIYKPQLRMDKCKLVHSNVLWLVLWWFNRNLSWVLCCEGESWFVRSTNGCISTIFHRQAILYFTML